MECRNIGIGFCRRYSSSVELEGSRAIAYENFWLVIGTIDSFPRKIMAHLPPHRENLAADHPEICDWPLCFPSL